MSQNYSYFFAFWWGITILAAFIGYGRGVSALAGWKNKEIQGWGMQASIGTGVVIGLGGILLLFSMAHQPVLVALVAIGAILAVFFVLFDISKGTYTFKFESLSIDFILWGLVFIIYATSVSWPGSIDPTDDFQGYLTMPEKIAQTGTLSEPFGLRRAYTLGGHVFLKSLIQCVTSERTGHLLDMGICKVILFGLLLGLTQEMKTKAPMLRLCFLAIAILVPVPRINTNSSLTGVCAIIPAFILIANYFTRSDWKLALQVGLLIASAITMRSLYLGPFAIACFIYCIIEIIFSSDKQKSIVSQFKLNSKLWLIVGIILSPWMILSLSDCGTPLWPLFGGNINPAFANTGSKEGVVLDVINMLAYLLRPEVFILVYLAALPLFWNIDRLTKLTAAASLLCVSYIAIKGGACLTRDIYRFTFPILFSQVILSFIALQRFVYIERKGHQNVNSGNPILEKSIIIGLSIITAISIPQGLNSLSEYVGSLYQQITIEEPFLPSSYRQEYQDLLKSTPEGSKILAAVDAPYLLDYKRNQIMNVDVIGGMSPDPGIPIFADSASFKNYLLKHDIQYILAVDWEKGLVSYNKKNIKENKREWFVNEVQTPYALRFMEIVDNLDANSNNVTRGSNTRLIPLTQL